jgi:hypothetical protein
VKKDSGASSELVCPAVICRRRDSRDLPLYGVSFLVCSLLFVASRHIVTLSMAFVSQAPRTNSLVRHQP